MAATLTAAKALVLSSRSGRALFEATARVAPLAVPSLPADLAGNLAVVRGTAAVDLQEFATTPVILGMRLVVLVNRGWLWWRHLDIAGVGGLSDDDRLALLAEVSDDSDYLVTV